MHRMFKTLPSLATACALAVTLAACNGSPSAPSTSGAAGGATEAGPNGETLKAQAPALTSPANDLRLDTRKPTLVINNVAGKFVGGTFQYEFEILTDSNVRVDGATLSSGAGGTTSWVYATDLERDTPYRWRARARMGNSVGPWSATRRFITVFEKRAPDPAPGTRLAYPTWGGAIVAQVASERPDLLRRSCQDEGGTWEFLDLVVDRLRAEDSRFGYNCKRGNCNDPSKDIVTYHYGAGPDQGSSDVFIIDTITGHCGPTPGPAWIDQTSVTINSGTIGRFTSRGRW